MINCPSCTTEQADTSKFCSACGAALRPEFEATVTHERAGAAPSSSVRTSLSDSSHHGQFLPGTEVADRYRIVSLVGKGGMGEVYRADDLRLGHTVALKFLPNELANDPQRLEYFRNEVRLSRQVSHPNVCRVYDIGEVDGQHFLSMEYIDGEDLKILLRRIGRLPRDKGVQIAQQICAGLAAAHQQGVLHRDLKPANIMIDGKGQVRITDFGLAKLASDGTAGEIAGTPTYMAPEQLAQGQTSVQSDLYSLGLILFELFTGQAVYEAGTIRELQEAHENKSLIHPSIIVDDMDPMIERVILRCLEREPYDRPKSAHALSAALPGGDPLAAALAAGETPTPEIVAAAGGAGGLSRRAAILMLIGASLCLLLNNWMANRTYLLRLHNPSAELIEPEDLIDAAEELIRNLSDDEDDRSSDAADRVHGFMTDGYEATFWYRQRKTHPFVMDSYWQAFGDPDPSRARPTFSRPPVEFANEVAIKLTPDGSLRYFRRLPAPGRERSTHAPVRQSESDGPNSAASDLPWSDWFPPALIGYQLETKDSLSSDSPDEKPRADRVSFNQSLTPWPPDAFDVVCHWKHDQGNGKLTSIVAAALNGEPVYFEVITADESSRDQGFDLAASQGQVSGQHSAIWKLQELLILIATVVLAWRNMRSGRGDRRGAIRLTQILFSIGVIIWFSQAHHLLWHGFEGEVVTLGLSQVLFDSVRIWLLYIAFEPLVRRFWPELLISAMRLLKGRYRDPLVGRDILVGVLAGLAIVVLHRINMIANETLHNEEFNHLIYFNTFSLLGPKELVGSVLDSVGWSITTAGMIVMFLLVVRLVVRSSLVAMAICVVFHTYALADVTKSDPRTWLVIGLWMTLNYLVVVRFGYLAFATVLATYFLACTLPATLDLNVWYADYSLFVSAWIAAIAVYGFYVSQGIRPGLASVSKAE